MAGAGALMSMGLHVVDLLRFLLGSEIAEISAFTDEQPPSRPVDETVLALMEFESGVHGVIISGLRVPRPSNDVVIYGSRARITGLGTVGMPLQGELLVEGESMRASMAFSDTEPISGNYLRQVEAFNRCLADNKEPDASGKDGLEAVRAANAILESSRRQQAVRMER